MKSESKIQQEIFIWHWNNLPHERGLLFMVHNNPNNAIEGARLRSQGLVKGVSDLIYLHPSGTAIAIEIKKPGGRQSKSQVKWQEDVQAAGYRYYLITSLEDFKELILKTIAL